jgi:hypothetical protein
VRAWFPRASTYADSADMLARADELGVRDLASDSDLGHSGRRGGLSLWALISGFERRCRGHAAYGWAACSGSSSGRLGSTSSPVEAPRSRLLTQGAAWTRAQRASIRRAATQPR